VALRPLLDTYRKARQSDERGGGDFVNRGGWGLQPLQADQVLPRSIHPGISLAIIVFLAKRAGVTVFLAA
jgi:hypothetical protein